MLMKKLLLILLSLIGLNSPAQNLNQALEAVKFRTIGPFRGGRANGVAGVVSDPLTYYMGTTGGGVWKTTDAGQRWENSSDGFFKTGSVGAVSVSESHPNIVYVGMGEHAPRGVMTSYGDGVYKSTDAGKTWQHMGLEQTRHIARIIIHPQHPDVIWVAAQGALHGPNSDRGIYKSTDGGIHWKKVLYINDRTGCSDLSIDYSNPSVLYASMWEHMRTPWKVISGGAGSGLYKSVDGGETWTKIHHGLPEEKGKMAISVSRANSEIVYALIESDSKAEKGGLFVSKNAGKSWSKVSGDHRLIQRAWYYIEVLADPNDEHTVYVLSASTYRSIDGGKHWEQIQTNHGDYHDLWINPNNSKNLIIADDGGAEISFNAGKTWSTQDNMPTAQLYRVAVDNQFPYHVYGGQQDNTSLKIASIGIGSSGIGREHWTYAAGGESAFLAFDPNHPNKTMGGSYLGTIELLDMESQAGTKIMIEPNLYLGLPARDMKYRYNWNAPIVRSVHEENTYYHGAQYLLRTRDEGMNWEVISPDLSMNDDSKQGNGGGPYTNEAVGAENYGTLSYIAESPHQAGVIYTGSDDGLVYLTKDTGKNWTNITPKGLPETLINAIEVSPHDPATVYIATTRYKFNDHTPALYKSTNYGKSWINISEGIPMGAYTRVVREDPVVKDLLVAGTELGLYLSYDGGKHWENFQSNLPIVPITDIQLKHDDIILGTQGRSFWILDDLSVLRQYDGRTEKGKLYKPEDAVIANWYSSMDGSNPSGTNPFQGVNPASGMVIYYDLPELDTKEVVTLEIRDQQGNLVRSYSSEQDLSYVSYEGGPAPESRLSKNKGLNRVVWDMRYESLKATPKVYIEMSFKGHQAIPGSYSVHLSYGTTSLQTYANVLPNPMYATTMEDYKDYHEFMTAGEQIFNEMTTMVNELYHKQQSLQSVIKQIDRKDEALLIKAKTLLTDLDQWDKIMVQRLSKAYDDVENFVNGFTAYYATAINESDSAQPKINSGARSRVAELNLIWERHKKAGMLLGTQLETLNTELYKVGIGAIH